MSFGGAVRTSSVRPFSCFLCLTRHTSDWSELDRDALQALDGARTAHSVKAGQVVFHQGARCLGVHCLARGTVALRYAEASGSSFVLRLAHPGEPLALEDVLAGDTYSVTAQALSDASVCFVHASALGAVLEAHPRLGQAFLRRLAGELQRSHQARAQIHALSVRSRIASLLLSLRDRFGSVDSEGCLNITLPLSRQDVAALVGARSETISRAIRDLQSDGVATFEGRSVRVPDLDRLFDEVEPE
jgi:CRP-like cAMP-binding protein